jgi:hypothetical protein
MMLNKTIIIVTRVIASASEATQALLPLFKGTKTTTIGFIFKMHHSQPAIYIIANKRNNTLYIFTN